MKEFKLECESGPRMAVRAMVFSVLLILGARFTLANGLEDQDTATTGKPIKIALVMSFEVGRNSQVDPANPDGPWIHPFSLPALHFYEGARLAVDSLSKRGVRSNTVCFESPVDSAKMDKLLDELARDSFNVIIGSVPDKLIPMAVKRTEKEGMKLILTQALSAEPIRGHSHCALAYASTATQCSLVVDRFLKKYPQANFVIIKGKNPREKEVAEAFRAAVDTLASMTATVRVVDLATSSSSSAASGVVPDRQNIIFFVSSDEPVVNPGLASLAKSCPRNTIICGMPTWVNFESIDFMSHERVQIGLFDNNYVDLSDPNRVKFRKRFVNAYFDDPLSSGFAGYDLFTYIVPLLKKYPEASLQDVLVGEKKRANKVYEFNEFPEGGIENHRMTLTLLVDYRFIAFEGVDMYRKEQLKKKSQGKW